MHSPYKAVLVLQTMADEVCAAERIVKDTLYSVQRISESIAQDIPNGIGLNKLGELQSAGPSLDVAIGRLELAAQLFIVAHRHLGEALTFSASDTPSEQIMKDMVVAAIARSPRLSKAIK